MANLGMLQAALVSECESGSAESLRGWSRGQSVKTVAVDWPIPETGWSGSGTRDFSVSLTGGGDMGRKVMKTFCLLLFGLSIAMASLLAPAALRAQVAGATLSGTVTDAQGATV